MTVKSYRELVCWQLSVQLRDEMIEITDRAPVARHVRFCEQVGGSTRSATANIAEGFGRSSKEFRQYLQIAMGSLRETETHIDEALQRKYVSEEEHRHLRRLTKRAYHAALGLSQYLARRIREARSHKPDGSDHPE
jgi:four helix bundle protein